MTGQFQLSDDQLAIQDMAQRFTADNITPHAGKWDEDHHFPVDTIKQTAELGFGAIYVSEESGGIGLGRLEAALLHLLVFRGHVAHARAEGHRRDAVRVPDG